MRIPRTSQRAAAAVNMTPMIDIVFLLIIFFLVSSHLAKRETRLPLDLPAASSRYVDADDARRLTIQITDDGVVQVAATPLTSEQISSVLVKHHRNQAGAAAVRIRTDKSVPYGVVETLLRDIAAAGIVDIAFAVREDR